MVGMIYTDMYMYLGGWGLAGSRHWCIYMYCVLDPPLGAPSLYSDRVVCGPSNRWTLSVFLQKLENYFKS